MSLLSQTEKVSAGCKPCLIFCGEEFESNTEYKRIKTFMLGKRETFKVIRLIFLFFFQFIQSWGFYAQLTLRQLIQPNLESRFIVRAQLGRSIQSGSSPGAGLQLATQSTHQSKDCYPELVSNPPLSEIRPPKQLDYRCMLLHPADSKMFTVIFLNCSSLCFCQFQKETIVDDHIQRKTITITIHIFSVSFLVNLK